MDPNELFSPKLRLSAEEAERVGQTLDALNMTGFSLTPEDGADRPELDPLPGLSGRLGELWTEGRLDVCLPDRTGETVRVELFAEGGEAVGLLTRDPLPDERRHTDPVRMFGQAEELTAAAENGLLLLRNGASPEELEKLRTELLRLAEAWQDATL